jgi:beta-N-acetylhexosaminidase
MTDDLKMGAITKNFSLDQVIMMTLQADVDILLVASQKDMHQKVFDILLDAVKSDKIPKSRIDKSVRRILQLKRRYLFESPGSDLFQASAESLHEIF